MYIQKLPSGSYRIRHVVDGKTYSVTVKDKPSQTEALRLINQKIGKKVERQGSFQHACKEYIEAKKNVLSPRSIREYTLYIGRLPSWFIKLDIAEITQSDVQKCVNELAKTKAPKTVRSLNGFISSVLGFHRQDVKFRVTLPQKVKKEPYIPTDEEVKRILACSQDTMFYIPIGLACNGLRRSEICALTVDDLADDNMLTIDKALVEDIKNKWVVKSTKTTSSTRTIPIAPEIADAIRKQGYIYNGSPQSISNYLLRTQNELGINNFSIHKLRHYFASKLLSQNVPMKDVMYLGGWETDTTLKEVYAHAMKTKTDKGKREISAEVWKSIF